MKINIERQQLIVETIDIDFPIYSFTKDDEYEIYTRITETKFTQIKIGFLDIIISDWKRDSICTNLPEIWIKNKSNKDEFEEAISYLKTYTEVI